MKRKLALLVLLALVLAGCATGTVSTKPDASKAPEASTSSAKIGQPITIKGNAEGAKAQVTAVRVLENTKPTDEFSTVEKGKRLVAVQFKIVNTGTAAYSDSPSNGAKVVDQQGQQFDADIMFQQVSAGPLLPASVKLAPGNKALGFLVFSVPKSAKITQVQFSMESGFGETAQWNVQ